MSRNENYLGLELPGVGAILVIMASQGVFYFIILFTVESGSGIRARQLMARLGRRGQRAAISPNDLRPRPSQVGFPDEDADVQNEREYILGTPLHTLCSSDAIVVLGLTKSFSGFRAVDSLTFRVPQVQHASPLVLTSTFSEALLDYLKLSTIKTLLIMLKEFI